MRDLTERALDTATSLGAGYADVRVVRRLDESIAIKTGRVEGVASGESEGFGVRVLVDGAWGFASSHILTARRGGPRRRRGRPHRPRQRHRPARPDRPRRPAARPRAATRRRSRRTRSRSRSSARSRDLLAADQAAARVKGIAFTESMYAAQREWKTFAATDGSFTEQTITHVGSAVEANAVDGDEHQRRSLPGLRRRLAGGRLRVHPGPRPGRPRRAARRRGGRPADRPAVPERPVHDRPRPEPALPPGPRELRPPDRARPGLRDRGELRRHELPDDRQARGGLPLRLRPRRHRRRRDGAGRDGHVRLGRRGRRGAGRAARPGRDLRRLPVVSRETAPRIGRQSGGAMRADGWNRIPLIRMTNINLLPKPGMSLDEIVADTDDGLYLASNRSWSIDDRRLNFQFATEVAYEIKGGKKGRLFKNPTYTGITYEFWRSCDAVGDERSYVMLGTPNCGKGEPGPDRPRRPRRAGRPVPRRPGRGRQVVAAGAPMNDDRARDALALAERVLGPRRARGRDRGRGPRHGRGRRADPLRQQPDPPERRRDERHDQPARSSSASGSASPRPAGPTTRACAGWPRTPRRSPGSSRSSRTGAACPSRPRSRTSPAAYAAATAEATPEFRADGVRAVIAAADAAGVTGYGSFSTGHRDDRRRQLEGRPRRGDPDRGPAAHRLDGPRRRQRVRGAGRGRRHDHRRGRDRPGGGGQGARDRERGRHRCRRLPGRPRGVRRRRPARHARLPRVLGARRPGGAQLRRDRQAHRQRPRLDRRRRPRPGRAADGVRLRGRRQAAGDAARARASAAASSTTRQTAARDGVALHRPRPAGPEPVRPVPAQPGHGRRDARRARS